MKKITFNADRVKLKTGHKVDNSGEVIFIVGEYQLANVKEFATIVDENMKVTVEVESE